MKGGMCKHFYEFLGYIQCRNFSLAKCWLPACFAAAGVRPFVDTSTSVFNNALLGVIKRYAVFGRPCHATK